LSMNTADPRREDLEEILRTADKARLLTRELLAFGRRQTSSPEILDINAVMRDKQKIFQRVLGADIEIELLLGRGIGYVQFDPIQLDQVLVNLVMNARDAMPQGGKILIETGKEEIPMAQTGLSTGVYVYLAITDTGMGIEPQVLPHIFEPFFTTKGK